MIEVIFFGALHAIRAVFIAAAVSVLTAYSIPALRERLFNYGARSTQRVSPKKSTQEDKLGTNFLDSIAGLKVPHNWFISFYFTSVMLSLLWITVLSVFGAQLAQFLPEVNASLASTPVTRTTIACVLLLCQGLRRFLECLYLTSSSTSTMWVGHWLVGMFFYAGMSLAIWIEGLPAIVQHEFSFHDLEIGIPNIRTAISLLLFTLASGVQHDCHAYLASLKSGQKSYQFPTFPAFSATLTPHYFMEIIIYLSLTILTAPVGHWINGTVACALVFVITNLGITAVGTRKWYKLTFGEEAVQGKAAMIPFVF